MSWSNDKTPRGQRIDPRLNEFSTGKPMYPHPETVHEQQDPLDDSEHEPTFTPPMVIDPETGHVETIGQGRIAIMGEQGVARLVTIPKSDDTKDVLIASGDLTYGA